MILAVMLGFMQSESILVLVLTTCIVLIAATILVDNVRTHKLERGDFRKKILHEALTILNRVASDVNYRHIEYPVWSGKAEGFKVDMLGHQDYRSWNTFYASVEERNGYFRSPGGMSWDTFQKLNRSCFDSFSKMSRSISWVEESLPQGCITDLLSKAKEHATL